MNVFFYKWLPIIFGCHCKKERSFHYHGKQFPICARCTGELVGILIAIGTCYFLKFKIYLLLLFMIPMVIDGFLQLLTRYESGNGRRFFSGLFFGYALASLFFMSVVYVYECGYEYGLRSLR